MDAGACDPESLLIVLPAVSLTLVVAFAVDVVSVQFVNIPQEIVVINAANSNCLVFI
jgi:hypothetical protein